MFVHQQTEVKSTEWNFQKPPFINYKCYNKVKPISNLTKVFDLKYFVIKENY